MVQVDIEGSNVDEIQGVDGDRLPSVPPNRQELYR